MPVCIEWSGETTCKWVHLALSLLRLSCERNKCQNRERLTDKTKKGEDQVSKSIRYIEFPALRMLLGGRRSRLVFVMVRCDNTCALFVLVNESVPEAVLHVKLFRDNAIFDVKKGPSPKLIGVGRSVSNAFIL